jgi:hypothetical protein
MHLFDKDTALSSLGPSRFEGTIADSWSINDTPNGGYLMAMLAGAMMRESVKKHTPIVTANYVSRCTAGRAEVLVEEISQSKQFNRLQAKLFQDGNEKIRAFGTFGEEKYDCFMVRYESPPPDLPPVEECLGVPAMPKFNLLENIDMRLDPSCAGWMRGALAEKSENRGWITFRDGRPFDLLSVFLIADAFPPAIFASQGLMGWVPTIELSINVRNVPETRWLKCVFRTRFINCGLMEEDGEVWDENGSLVAISRQIAQFRRMAT